MAERHAGLEQGALVELDMVGGDLQRGDALGLHVADEVHEVAAVGFDRVVRQQGVADPGHQGPGDGGRSAAGLQGVGQEGLRPCRRPGRRPRGSRCARGRGEGGAELLQGGARDRRRCMAPSPRCCTAGCSGPGVAGQPCHCSGKITLESGEGMESMGMMLPDERREHKADYVP